MSEKGLKQEGVFIHHFADIASNDIGANTRIWQFVVILQGARIVAGCNIFAHVLIEGVGLTKELIREVSS